MKKNYLKDIKMGSKMGTNLMVMKILSRDESKLIAYMGDKSGDVKAVIEDKKLELSVGDVISFNSNMHSFLDIKEFKIVESFEVEDFLPSIEKPIIKILNELESLTEKELKSQESISLNAYFFKDEKFLKEFEKAIGGISQHHNYRGGLAEHTLNVTYLAKTLAYRYDCRHKEIAILGAKLHDIGKIHQYYYDKPFSTTLAGDMEGHIVIGVKMVEEAFKSDPRAYSEDFKRRIKGCIVQHHGKVEYGSPISPNMEESHIIHFADYIDAQMNKISRIKKGVPPNTWTPYDRKLEGKLYI